MAIDIAGDATNRWRIGHRRLVRGTLVPAWVVLGVVALAHLAGVSLPVPARYGVLLVTLVLFGLPHGAADHHSVVRALDIDLTPRFLLGFCAGYLLLAGAYTVVWFLAPVLAFLFFLALTWFHWGQGDVYSMATLADGAYLRDSLVGALSIVVRGGLPMLVPLLFFPERYSAVARAVVGLFAPGADWFSVLVTSEIRLLLGCGFASLTVLALVLGARRATSRHSWRIDAGETLLLWVYFAVVPPVLAIGVYFAVWHSLRHISRLVELDRRALAALDRGAVRQTVGRFVRDALPATVGAVLLFGGFALAVPESVGSVPDIGGVYLVLLAVLTLPHVVVVSWLDVRQGLWRPNGSL
ncbi:brp-like protein 2 [Halobacteriales archaeon QS_4_62_28]|nr:MAG: brp-like protein 2 [Halobacteriales archaeon QS_4_62_28]